VSERLHSRYLRPLSNLPRQGRPMLLADLRRHTPELDVAVALAEEFTELIRDHAPDRLDPWLQRAGTSTARHLRSFAKRLGDDYAAVHAGVEQRGGRGTHRPTENHQTSDVWSRRSRPARLKFSACSLVIVNGQEPTLAETEAVVGRTLFGLLAVFDDGQVGKMAVAVAAAGPFEASGLVSIYGLALAASSLNAVAVGVEQECGV